MQRWRGRVRGRPACVAVLAASRSLPCTPAVRGRLASGGGGPTEHHAAPEGDTVLERLQEIEVVGTALSKSGAVVEITAQGGGTEVVGVQIDPSLAGKANELGNLLTQAAQDAFDQVQYEVKRKLVEVSMSTRRQQQLKERDRMLPDLKSFKETE